MRASGSSLVRGAWRVFRREEGKLFKRPLKNNHFVQEQGLRSEKTQHTWGM